MFRFITGGFDQSSGENSDVEVLDIDPHLKFRRSMQFHSGTLKVDKRENHSSVIYQGRMYLFGGKQIVDEKRKSFFFFIFYYYTY
jgi:hypothetical protein